MQGRRSPTFTKGTPRCLTFRSSHMQQTPREPVPSSFLCVWSLHSVTHRGNVSSKRACVWDLEILLLSGMLVVKTTGCKGIWPSLGSRGIIGWFHTKVNCSNVKSGKTGTFRNKTYAEGRWFSFFSFFFFGWGYLIFSWELKWGDCHLTALAFIRFRIDKACSVEAAYCGSCWWEHAQNSGGPRRE